MIVPAFLPGSMSVTVLRATETPDPRYGTLRRDWANPTATVVKGCAVQQVSATEADVDREYAATHVRLFAPADADLAATDRVEYAGTTYEVDGEPAVWLDEAGRPHHIEAELKRMTG